MGFSLVSLASTKVVPLVSVNSKSMNLGMFSAKEIVVTGTMYIRSLLVLDMVWVIILKIVINV